MKVPLSGAAPRRMALYRSLPVVAAVVAALTIAAYLVVVAGSTPRARPTRPR